MMEKEMNKFELDQLIRGWTEEEQLPETDKQITDSLLDFIDSDDTETDVEELLEAHIHALAMEEKKTRLRKWKILVSSIAAASVALHAVVGVYLTTNQPDTPANEEFLVEHRPEVPRIVNENESQGHATETVAPISAKTMINALSKGVIKSTNKPQQIPLEEETSEAILAETLAEINAGLANMVDNANECLYLADTYQSTQTDRPIQSINVIEANLIDALNEIRNLNINLNIETKQNDI